MDQSLSQPSFLQKLFSYRGLAGLLTLASVVGMSFAFFYLQKTVNLDPCPLCIFQRIGLIVMGVFALLAFLFNPKSVQLRIALMIGALLGMLWGMAIAIRHIWIQHLPADQVPSCGPGLSYWMDTLPIMQVFKAVLQGSGECAVIDWTFLGLSIPQMTLAFFLVLTGLIVMAIVQAKKSHF